MVRANIADARDGFSNLLKHVRQGETVLITDRGRPVAQLGPCSPGDEQDPQLEALLARPGVARPPRKALDVEAFLKRPIPQLPSGVRASDAVTADRDEGW